MPRLKRLIQTLLRHSQLWAALGLAFLMFLTGVAAMRYSWAPGRAADRGMMVAELWSKELEAVLSWTKSTNLDRLMVHTDVTWDQEHSENGYTLITARFSESAYLVNMKGTILHKWNIPFESLWPEPLHISNRRALPYLVRAHAFPNGDLLAIYEAIGDTPYGYGLAKVNRDGEPIWTFDHNVHHDFYLDHGNGNIYTLTHEWQDTKDPLLPDTLLGDYVTILSPDGKLLQNISIFDAFRGTPYQALLYRKVENTWDRIHANSVMKLEPDMAKKFPMFKAGDILISSRELSVLAVIDPASGKVKWAAAGPWKGQHAAQFLPNGNILLYDNQGHEVKGITYSRVLEFNPANLSIGWYYAGSEEQPFFSMGYGHAQKLSNQNMLITEPFCGHIFEMTPQKKIVWDYKLYTFDVRKPDEPMDPDPIGVLCQSFKYPYLVKASYPLLNYMSGVITSALRYNQNELPFLKNSKRVIAQESKDKSED